MPMTEANITASTLHRDVYTVSRLNRTARDILEGSFPLMWVEGEISNLSRPGSGHWYFSLKDTAAQVRCAMFSNRNRVLGFTPSNGAQVLLRAQVSLYENRGDFQLIVEHMEQAGDGALRLAFEALKQRLSKEGLFDAARKRPLPALPTRIGVVTSPHGAALRDIISVLQRRFRAIPVIIYPTAVQGAKAATDIAAALRLASARSECDVLILARGGGSLEDLWAFNEEVVARAIYQSAIPVVSGVGHETDVTIADFVADLRAPTPSTAAESVSPDSDDWLQRLRRFEQRIAGLMRTLLADAQRNTLWLSKRIQHPAQRLARQSQRLDELELRLSSAQRQALRSMQQHLHTLRAHLLQHSPEHLLRDYAHRCTQHAQRLRSVMQHRIELDIKQLANLSHALQTISPLATLGRGYALVQRADNKKIVKHATDVQPGVQIEARLQQGRLLCTVNETSNS